MKRLVLILIIAQILTACGERRAQSDSTQTANRGSSYYEDIEMVEKPILSIEEEPVAKIADYLDERLDQAVDMYNAGQRQQALPIFSDYARRDNPVALNYMGHYATINMAGIQDRDLAETYYRRAAILGYAPAQHNLAMMLSGEGASEEDYAEAAQWFMRAASQNYAPSLYNLGVRYVMGVGVPVNYEEAVNDFQRAAQLGVDAARYNLAVIYGKADSGKYDPQLCFVWGSLALEKYEQANTIVRDCSAQLADNQRADAVNNINQLRGSLSN